MKMIKLRSMKSFSRSNSKLDNTAGASNGSPCEIKWELRPGGMLVQKRESSGDSDGDAMITIRVSAVSKWHDISIQSTSTFGELKLILSLVTNLEPKEQRLLFKGKEREDDEYLHMVGVRDQDKVLLLEDPAIKERKLMGIAGGKVIGSSHRPIKKETAMIIVLMMAMYCSWLGQSM